MYVQCTHIHAHVCTYIYVYMYIHVRTYVQCKLPVFSVRVVDHNFELGVGVDGVLDGVHTDREQRVVALQLGSIYVYTWRITCKKKRRRYPCMYSEWGKAWFPIRHCVALQIFKTSGLN